MWFTLAAVSAIFLGFYDVFKKFSLTGNAVLPVLLLSTAAGALFFVPIWFISKVGIIDSDSLIFIPMATLWEHFLIIIKTLIVLSSWILAYFAVKHLPLTIVAPIRATGPIWTLAGALIIFNEQLSALQWTGFCITLVFFFLFSISGRHEGISIRNNKWLWFIMLGTIAGAASGLYDKFLLRHVNRMTVQCYFSFYQFAIMSIVIALLWWPKRHKSTKLEWRWSIPMIGIALILADFLYFYALSYPESLVSVVSALRRGSVVIAFLTGALLLKERRILQKSIYLVGILIGMGLLLFGSA
ncbi:MAG: EamA family transporter [Marinilabiliaceae bacterium]|nr:EamA family transporter [Marinilabiliaceae bacterium]